MAGDISNLSLVQTLFLVEEDGLLRHVLDLQLDNSGGVTPGRVQVQIGGTTWTTELPMIGRGLQRFRLTVPEVLEPTPARIRLVAGGEEQARQVLLQPVRHWKVFLVHFSHHDLGYTDLPEVCIKQHKDYFDRIVQYCRQTDDLPEEARFRWTCDTTWALKYYLNDRTPEAVRQFMDLVRAGRIEITAQFAAFNSALLSHEELVRSLYYAFELAQKHGFEITSAMTTDIPGAPWGFPQALAKSGVRYLSTAVNQHYSQRGQPRARVPRIARPFYWAGPDGSEVLVWNADSYYTYLEGRELGFGEDYERVFARLPGYLATLERDGYLYDAIHLRTTFKGCDNAPPCPFLPWMVSEWNRRWAYPRLILGTSTRFFRYMEETFSDRFPHYAGDWTDWWIDGPGSSADETGLNRVTHERLASAEKLATLCSLVDGSYEYPRAAIREAYDDMMLYDEHTWGMWNCYTDPYLPTTGQHWQIKADFARRAARAGERLLEAGSRCLGRHITTGEAPAIAVLNPLSWARTDLVRVRLDAALLKGAGDCAVVTDGGELVPHQVLEADAEGGLTIAFVAEDVPPVGYRAYHVAPAQTPGRPATRVQVEGNTIENPYYRVSLDPQTGGVASIFDKELGVELVDKGSAYRLNQYVYDRGEPPNHGRFSPERADVHAGPLGPLSGSLVAVTRCGAGRRTRASAPRDVLVPYATPWIRQEVVLYERLKRIDLVNRLYKEETLEKEGVYYAFPCHVPGGTFKVEVAGAIMTPGVDQLPDSCHDWHAVGYWLDVSNADYGITWSSREAPVVSLGDINTGKWQTSLGQHNSTFFAYAMNNYWDCNFRERQGGDATFRFSLTSHGPRWGNVQAARFGWGYCTDLVPIVLPAGQAGALAGASHSFCELDRPNVMAFTLKLAEDGDGYIIRLAELLGEDTTVTLSLPGVNVAAACRTDMVERNLAELESTGSTVVLPVPAFGIEAVRVRCARSIC